MGACDSVRAVKRQAEASCRHWASKPSPPQQQEQGGEVANTHTAPQHKMQEAASQASLLQHPRTPTPLVPAQ